MRDEFYSCVCYFKCLREMDTVQILGVSIDHEGRRQLLPTKDLFFQYRW